MTSSKVKAYLACLCIPNNSPGAGKYSAVIRKKEARVLGRPWVGQHLWGPTRVVAGRAAGIDKI